MDTETITLPYTADLGWTGIFAATNPTIGSAVIFAKRFKNIEFIINSSNVEGGILSVSVSATDEKTTTLTSENGSGVWRFRRIV